VVPETEVVDVDAVAQEVYDVAPESVCPATHPAHLYEALQPRDEQLFHGRQKCPISRQDARDARIRIVVGRVQEWLVLVQVCIHARTPAADSFFSPSVVLPIWI